MKKRKAIRKKVNEMMERFEGEKEKSRRYQKQYRKNYSPSKTSEKTIHDRSIDLRSLKQLAKHGVKKHKRNCLKCGKKFIGIGKYNRICNTCTRENSCQSSLRGV